MSTAQVDFEQLLRQAVTDAKANAPRAIDDLLKFASRAAEAVARVTGGLAVLELVLINQGEPAPRAYQLQLRKPGSEAPPSDIGIYTATASGYPVNRWYSRNKWDANPDSPDQQYLIKVDLESHFKWMVSNPDSRLVGLVTFFQQMTSG